MAAGFSSTPDDILLQIIQYLELRDIFALRKTCFRLCVLTQDRHTWLQILQEHSYLLPLPLHLEHPSSWIPLSSGDLEMTARQLYMVNRTWLFPRSHYFLPEHHKSCTVEPVYHNDNGVRTIHSIQLFLDRWLVCIYHEKRVEIWDLDLVIHDSQKPVLCTSQQIKGAGSFSSAMTYLDEHGELLTIAVCCHESCHVMQVQLHRSSAIFSQESRHQRAEEIHFQNIAIIPFNSPVFALRAIYPKQSLLLLGVPSSFHLYNWDTRRRMVINMVVEEEEALWNGVIGATFLTPRHILILKAHSVEICTLLEESPQAYMNSPEKLIHCADPRLSPAVHSHHFGNPTFRGVSFSRVTSRPNGSMASGKTETTVVSVSFLAYDVIHGLFHCKVTMLLPVTDPLIPCATSAPLDIHISLLAAHNMAVPIAPGLPDAHVPRSGFSNGHRGFICACAIGTTGRRGVWVERRRGAVRRVVYGFAASYDSSEDNPQKEFGVEWRRPASGVSGRKGMSDEFDQHTPTLAALSDLDSDTPRPSWNAQTAPAIEGRQVYEVNSYDLRDDVTHVAFSETTGLIALGTRKGEIRVLGRADLSPNGD